MIAPGSSQYDGSIYFRPHDTRRARAASGQQDGLWLISFRRSSMRASTTACSLALAHRAGARARRGRCLLRMIADMFCAHHRPRHHGHVARSLFGWPTMTNFRRRPRTCRLLCQAGFDFHAAARLFTACLLQAHEARSPHSAAYARLSGAFNGDYRKMSPA